VAIQKNLAQIQKAAEKLGLSADPNSRGKESWLKPLRDYYLKQDYPNGIPFRMIMNPMLCRNYKDITPAERQELNKDGNEWSISVKKNGVRMVLVYKHPGKWYAYSRNTSVKTFRNAEYHEKLIFQGKEIPGVKSFEIDNEALCYDYKKVDTRLLDRKNGKQAEDTLHATTQIFALEKEASLKVQKIAPVHFEGLALLEWDGEDYVGTHSLEKNFADLKKLVALINEAGFPHIHALEHRNTGKDQAYKSWVASGEEGVVYVNLKEVYQAAPTPSIRPKFQLKRKKNLEFDLFVGGFTPPDKDSAYEKEGLIGGLKMFTYLPDGSSHWFATVSNLELVTRREWTIKTNAGKMDLRGDIYGSVAEVHGQEVSAREKRLVHARAMRWRNDPKSPDFKQASDCILEISLDEVNETAE